MVMVTAPRSLFLVMGLVLVVLRLSGGTLEMLKGIGARGTHNTKVSLLRVTESMMAHFTSLLFLQKWRGSMEVASRDFFASACFSACLPPFLLCFDFSGRRSSAAATIAGRCGLGWFGLVWAGLVGAGSGLGLGLPQHAP